MPKKKIAEGTDAAAAGSGYPSHNASSEDSTEPLPHLTLEQVLSLQSELLAGYSEGEFQKIMKEIVATKGKGYEFKRQQMCLEIQNKVLPKYGFTEGHKGVHQMEKIFNNAEFQDNEQFKANIYQSYALLGLKDEKDGKGNGVAGRRTPSGHVQVTVMHAVNHGAVHLQVPPDATLAKVREFMSDKLHRPELMRKGKFVKKDEDTGYFTSIPNEKESVGNRKKLLFLGVDDLNASREVPTVAYEQAVDLVSEICKGFLSEPFQVGNMRLDWLLGAEPEQLEVEKDKLVFNTKRPVLMKFGFEGTARGLDDMHKMMRPFMSDRKLRDLQTIANRLEAFKAFEDPDEIEQHFYPDCDEEIRPHGCLLRAGGGVYHPFLSYTEKRIPKENEVVVMRSQMGREPLKNLPTMVWKSGHVDGKPSIVVDASITYQTFLGFGTSFSQSATDLLMKLGQANRRRVLNWCFHEELGLGYKLGRVHINSCDFSTGNWACCEKDDDTQLKTFNIMRYHKSIIPVIKEVQEVVGEHIMLLASPWSPPRWMKDTDQMCEGGKLKPECREAWARYYIRFAESFQAAKVPLWALSVQNEPMAKTAWENCLYTATEERDFVRDYLGPELTKSNLDLKLLVWDHNRDDMLNRARTIYADPEASKYVWGLAFHWYGDHRYEHWADKAGQVRWDNVARVHELKPEKHLVMSEATQEGGPHLNRWTVGERYAESIIRDLNNWTEAWIDWNLILDMRGGPNHVSNFCSAAVLADPDRDLVFMQPIYTFLYHFARIRPGARRIMCGTSRDALEATAFQNIDGSIIVVVLNQSKEDIDFSLQVGLGKMVETEAPSHSITTYVCHANSASA